MVNVVRIRDLNMLLLWMEERKRSYIAISNGRSHLSMTFLLNDRLCIRMSNKVYECHQIFEWLEKKPLAVLVENVINRGPSIREDVYKMFLNKFPNIDLALERLKYRNSINNK